MVLKKRPIKRIYSQRRDRFPFVDYAQSIYFLYLSSLTSNMSKFQCHKRAGEGRALHHVCLQSGDQRGPLHNPQTLITLVTVPISLWSITHCAHVALNHIHIQLWFSIKPTHRNDFTPKLLRPFVLFFKQGNTVPYLPSSSPIS